MFRDNFEKKFATEAGEEIAGAGPLV
jgi:hypothetical protein